MPAVRYQLSSNVYACLAGGQFVFLILPEDRYTCLDAPTSASLCPALQNVIDGQVALDPASCGDQEVILCELTKARILVESAEAYPSKRFTAPPVAAAALGPKFTAARAFGARHAVDFFASVTIASARLRFSSLQGTVARERSRSRRVVRTFDQALAQDLLTAFAALRVFWSTPRQCLFDSLALRIFLARYGLHVHWVFGVRMNPFAAHCWIQHENTLLNDSVEFVRGFTPIMTV